MRTLRIFACLSFILCFCFSVSPIMAEASSHEVIQGDEPEIEKQVENVAVMHGVATEITSYDLYEAKASLAKKAATNCVAVSMAEDKCCGPSGACCYCDGCSADSNGCSCPEGEPRKL